MQAFIKKIYPMAIFFTVYIIYAEFAGNCERKRVKERSLKLYARSVAGRISYIHASSGVTQVGFKGENEYYRIFPEGVDPEQGSFYLRADIGDSVFKNSSNDTITLYRKDNKKYVYTFYIFNDGK